MSYPLRIAIVALLLALLTGLVLWRGPAVRTIAMLTQAPTGEAVTVGAPVRIIFSRPVDRLSVEERLTLEPPASGRFFWEGQTLTFQPDQPLRSGTSYTVTLQPGVRDQEARTSTTEPLGWTFRTREPRLLLLQRGPDGASTLLLTSATGDNREIVLREPDWIEDGIAAPDGSAALVTVLRAAGRMALLLVNLDDGTTRPLVDTPDRSARTPAWSPNGTLIAFEQRSLPADGTPGAAAVWLAQPDGTSLGPVSSDAQRWRMPVWSPDSSKLALYEAATSSTVVYNFTSMQQTFPQSSGGGVAWAPDSTALVYASDTPGVLQRASLAPAEPLEALTVTNSAAALSDPAWSPDGAWIACVQQPTADTPGAVWLVRPDGSAPRQLAAPPAAADSQPVWSPTSQHLAFLRTSEDGRSAAWVSDLASGDQWQVAEDVARVVWVP